MVVAGNLCNMLYDDTDDSFMTTETCLLYVCDIVMYATFGNHLASFVKTGMCCNETLVDVTRKCRATYLVTVC
jgi:hypothetical protein